MTQKSATSNEDAATVVAVTLSIFRVVADRLHVAHCLTRIAYMLRIRCGARSAVPTDDPRAVRWWAPRHSACDLLPISTRSQTRHESISISSQMRDLERSPVRPIRVASLAVGAAPARRAGDRLSAPPSIITPAARPCVHGKFL